jgi:peptidoglycan/LPS O-acetylase OafA/YrhL
MSSSNVAHRYEYIDSLRGLAALSVMYYHIGEFFPPDNGLEKALFSLIVDKIDLGKIGVTVFFAISGFVIPFSLFRPSKTPIRDFAISRFFRLYPAYWLSLILSVALSFYVDHRMLPVHVLIVNVSMLQQFFGIPNAIGVYWTLQIELIFYVVCAALFVSGFLRKPGAVLTVTWVLLLFALLLGSGRYLTGKSLPVAIPLALSVMFFGYLWRELIINNAEHLRRPIFAVVTGFVVVWPVIFFFAYGDQEGGVLRYTLTYYFSLAIFLLLTTRLKVTANFTAYLGKISYSLYLFGSLATVLGHHIMLQVFHFAPTYLVAIFATIVGISVASLSYHFLELPAIALGRSLMKPARRTEQEIEEAQVL